MNQENTNEPFSKTAVICCGNLEKMNINWMVLEDGTKIMPFLEDKKDNTKWRVNNCPSCGAYVSSCTIQP
jgi:hypothetical protein